jgi:ribonuclease HI
MVAEHLILFCDGSVRGNPGPAGIGVVVADENGMPLKRFGEQLPPCTNNEAEYHALVRGLRECLRLGASQVDVYMDSDLVRLQVLGDYQVNAPHLQALCEQARQLLQRFSAWRLERIESERNLAHTYANIASTQNRQRPQVHIDTQHNITKGGSQTMKLVVTAQAQTLPEDVYVVALLAVEAQNGAYGEQLVWQLQVAEGEYEGATLKAWTNASTAVNSKAVRWASAFAGRPFRQGEEIDLLALVGKRARAVVNQKQATNGNIYARVTDILPLPQKRVLAQAPTQMRVKDNMVAVPATAQGFYEDDYDPNDPFAEE